LQFYDSIAVEKLYHSRMSAASSAVGGGIAEVGFSTGISPEVHSLWAV
jgi:hypothetical protein